MIMDKRLEKYIRSEIIPYLRAGAAYRRYETGYSKYPNNTTSAVLLCLYLARETPAQSAYRRLKGIKPYQMTEGLNLEVVADWMNIKVPEVAEKLKKFITDNEITNTGEISRDLYNLVYGWCANDSP